jgi:peptide/nickel transport system ATP-binding protein
MPGLPPGVGERPPGCAFADRCPQAIERCLDEPPLPSVVSARHTARCHRWMDTPGLSRPGLREVRALTADSRPVVLEVRELGAVYRSGHGNVVAARDVSLTLRRGASVALVGESGSGKTTIARTIAGLHPVAHGSIVLHGETLADHAGKRTVEQRRQLQLIFQNPAEALNPRRTVRSSISRVLTFLRGLSGADVATEVDRLLSVVRLPSRFGDRYPAELSGGELQRVAIARALAASPEVLVCDEITSALDVSVQAVVIELLISLRSELGLSLLFITHDLGVVQLVADSVLVLERGVVCEQGTPSALLSAPAHPYTRRLLEAAPSLSTALEPIDRSDSQTEAHPLPATTNETQLEGPS